MLWIILIAILAGFVFSVGECDGDDVIIGFTVGVIIIGGVATLMSALLSMDDFANNLSHTTVALKTNPDGSCATLTTVDGDRQYLVTETNGHVRTLPASTTVNAGPCSLTSITSRGPKHFWFITPFDAHEDSSILNVPANGVVVK